MPAPGYRWADVKPCGTPAAARRHLRRGEPPCESCRQAEARRQQDRYDPGQRHARYLANEVSGWQRIVAHRTERAA